MICQDFLPSPPLREYIKCYHFRHFVFSDATSLPFKPYAPRPEQTLAFYPRDHELVEHVSSQTIIKRHRSAIIGQYAERTNRHLGGSDFIALIVNFQPGVLYRITGIPFYELTNTSIDAEAVFSKEIRQVNEQLNSAEDYKEMIEIIERFLLHLVHKIKTDAHPIDALTNLMIERPEDSSIVQMAKESFLCMRQFERRFRERMGIGPKVFTRIARLNKAFRIKYQFPNEDWLRIAVVCGYHDYQHLAKDFRDFTGVAPTSYFLEDNTNAPERLFGLRDSAFL